MLTYVALGYFLAGALLGAVLTPVALIRYVARRQYAVLTRMIATKLLQKGEVEYAELFAQVANLYERIEREKWYNEAD